MITFLFCMLMLAIFGKLAVFAFRAAWSVTKMVVCFVFAPLLLLILLISGLLYIAFPILLIVGIASLLASRV